MREDEIKAALTMSPRVWGRPDLRRILAAPTFNAAVVLIHLPAVTIAPPTREFPES